MPGVSWPFPEINFDSRFSSPFSFVVRAPPVESGCKKLLTSIFRLYVWQKGSERGNMSGSVAKAVLAEIDHLRTLTHDQ